MLVLELCKYDLNHLIKIEPFNEDNTVLFLHQLGKLMKHNMYEAELKCSLLSFMQIDSKLAKHKHTIHASTMNSPITVVAQKQ